MWLWTLRRRAISPIVERRLSARLSCAIRAVAWAAGAGVAFGLFAGPAAGVEPIRGDWVNSDGQVVQVHQTGAGLQGVVLKGAGVCPPKRGFVAWKNMTDSHGKAGQYSGAVPFVYTGTCVFAYDAPSTFVVDGELLTISSQPPNGGTVTSFYTRVNTPTVNSTLPVVVNGILVGFRNEYNRLGSGGKSARKHYAAISKAAGAGHARVKTFKIAANGDRTLKACALQGIANVSDAARSRRKQAVGNGIRALTRCLAPYKLLFPGASPGTPPPKAPAGHTPAPSGTYSGAPYHGVGVDPKEVPRVDFHLDTPAGGSPSLVDMHLTISVTCQSEGTFLLTAGPEDFPFIRVLGDSTFSVRTDIGLTRLTFSGEIVKGGARGRIQIVANESAKETCTAGGLNGRAWYAHAS